MISEFDLIKKYFARPTPKIPLGIGDDCALLSIDNGMHLAISSDMLVSERHFFRDADPKMLGHKSLAVNLSDLAAMGAKPIGYTMAVALPEADEGWVKKFSEGMFALADKHGCPLIGGDTTKGPLNICVTVFGEVPKEKSLRRDAAKIGDDIWVSGTIGDARLALAHYRGEIKLSEKELSEVAPRMHVPTPRVELGIVLLDIAHAALDISDGLIGDLGHILSQSKVGAVVNIDALPASKTLAAQSDEIRRRFTFAGGDDYELCFTAPKEKRSAVEEAGKRVGVKVTRIGEIESADKNAYENKSAIRTVDANGDKIQIAVTSFDHFKTK